MSVTYRDATEADLPAVDRVYRESFCDTFAHLYSDQDLTDFLAQFTPDAWRREFNSSSYRFRVAEDDGAVVGFVKLGPSALPVETSRRAIELRQIYVLNSHRGRGIAKELTAWATDYARANGFEELYLTVYVDNARARALYDKIGFQEVGPYAFMVGSQADEDIIMRLDL